MENQLDRAKKLIKAGRYAEARKLITPLDFPEREQWLRHIDKQIRKAQQDAPQAAPARSATAAKKSLPLLPHEEQELLPQGRPINPREILSAPSQLRGRAYIMMLLWGAKSIGLINNYRRLKKTGLFAFLGLLYFTLVIAWFPCFPILMLLVDRLMKTGGTHFPALLLTGGILILLPFTPHIIAWAQQEDYEQWLSDYDKLRADYYDRAA